MGTHLKDPLVWLHGLLAACIGGGATAITSVVGLAVAHGFAPDKVAMLDLNQIWAVFGAGALASGAAYLKQSPVPALETTDTVSITKRETTTTTHTKDNE
jgi:hypothetical protein